MKNIFDIFSKRAIKEKEKPKILVDYREKNSLVISELLSLGFDVEMRELKIGDYIINGVIIERKTVQDFVFSMKSGRLVKQLSELKQCEERLLFIEGIDEQDLYQNDFSEEVVGMHPNSIRGFLLSILLKYKVPIIFTKNYQDTARFMSVLSRKKSKELPLNMSKKTLNKKERMQFILEGFQSIGPKTAKKLLKKFKSIRNIINASQEELKNEIGKKAESFKLVEEEF
ncbi:hypothetical protein HY448_02805 [Candidatus Pacearchaeota archaeon]|nr:hypothetical protein [Candidatus Pacearchaeota archaeon]